MFEAPSIPEHAGVKKRRPVNTRDARLILSAGAVGPAGGLTSAAAIRPRCPWEEFEPAGFFGGVSSAASEILDGRMGGLTSGN